MSIHYTSKYVWENDSDVTFCLVAKLCIKGSFMLWTDHILHELVGIKSPSVGSSIPTAGFSGDSSLFGAPPPPY